MFRKLAAILIVLSVLSLGQAYALVQLPNAITIVAPGRMDSVVAPTILGQLNTTLYYRQPNQSFPTRVVVVVGGPAINPLTKEFASEGYIDTGLLDKWFYPKVWWDVHFGLFQVVQINTTDHTYIVVWGTGIDGTAAGLVFLEQAWKLGANPGDNVTGMWFDTWPGAMGVVASAKNHNVGFGGGDVVLTDAPVNTTVENYTAVYQPLAPLYNSGVGVLMNAINYTVPTWNGLLDFLASDTTDLMSYSSRWICVDYAWQLVQRAKLYGITSVGIVLGTYNGHGHAWNIAIYRDGGRLDYVFIEPQSDYLFKSDPRYKPERIILLG